jgi:hypothetical protein
MLFGAGQFLGNFANQRICWIGGKLGGHKTAFAYRMAYDYLSQGYRLVTNNLSVWTDRLADVALDEKGYLKAFILLDEGGLFFNDRHDVQQVAAYLSKMDSCVVLPSAQPPSRSAQGLILQPIWSFRNTGIPVILYQWKLANLMQRSGGFFIWWRPSEIYGIYSRRDPGTNCEEIRAFMDYRTEQYKALFEREADYSWKEESDRENTISAMARPRREVDPAASAMAEAAGAITDAAAEFEAVSQRGRRRRWRRL